jgi:hypothetical protein
MTHQKLPLFPLHTVMYPGAPLTLHIFEERYKEMLGRCIEQNTPFGVVLIREGSEVGEPANPYDVGTMVQINASVRLEDDRMLIATIGQRRFRIQYMLQTLPYLVASVAMLPEENSAELTQASQRLRSIHDEYWQAIKAATGSTPEVEALPPDAVAMSYHLAHRLQVSNERKQHWLEVAGAQRVREIATMLRAEIALLPRPGDERTSGPNNIPWSWN